MLLRIASSCSLLACTCGLAVEAVPVAEPLLTPEVEAECLRRAVENEIVQEVQVGMLFVVSSQALQACRFVTFLVDFWEVLLVLPEGYSPHKHTPGTRPDSWQVYMAYV